MKILLGIVQRQELNFAWTIASWQEGATGCRWPVYAGANAFEQRKHKEGGEKAAKRRRGETDREKGRKKGEEPSSSATSAI